ncbi:electron transfer flavoprotein subunit alpha/FixB family protein [Cupriavidus necator]
MMPATAPRSLAVLIADDGYAHAHERHARAVLEAARGSGRATQAIAVLVGGEHDDALVARIAALGYARVVLVTACGLRLPVQASDVAKLLAEALTQGALAPLGVEDLLCFAAGAIGEETAATLAMAHGAVALGRVHALTFDGRTLLADKAVFGGRSQATIRADYGPWLCAFRGIGNSATAAMPGNTGAYPSAAAQAAPAEIVRESYTPPASVPDEVTLHPSKSQRRPVETACLVVSGGRGMRSAEGFALLEQLAAHYEGAVGASLPAIDAGWLPVTHQVGQSGKFVTPRVYLAVGISGTPQHLAGIGDESSIVAINNDPDAEIFKHADLGVVGEWEHILPALIARVASARAV